MLFGISSLHGELPSLHNYVQLALVRWCRDHVQNRKRKSRLTGNERADKLAKIGIQAPQTQNPVTHREAKTLLHSRYNGDWKKDNGGYQAHLDPTWRLEWAPQTSIFRLHTGHCGLGAPQKRTGISDTSLCECGQADQTPDHVLQSCPIYTERHQLTWPQGADLATKLWDSAEDLYWTAGFVASAGLKLLPARLSIAEEEEEEDFCASFDDSYTSCGDHCIISLTVVLALKCSFCPLKTHTCSIRHPANLK